MLILLNKLIIPPPLWGRLGGGEIPMDSFHREITLPWPLPSREGKIYKWVMYLRFSQ